MRKAALVKENEENNSNASRGQISSGVWQAVLDRADMARNTVELSLLLDNSRGVQRLSN